ncbi:MAG: TIGR02281 family clan AA aspartic protease [Mesorhizobium sp.]|nr:TIGR02281 family clan AA aspartic protease [Mesorhizobium sp.]
MRNFILIGIVVAMSMAVPIAYERYPEMFHRAAAPAPAGQASAELTRVAAAPATEMSVTGRRVRVAADAAGHFRVDLKFNGRRTVGMIDTGASLVAINNSTARRIGIIVPPDDFKHEVNTANGKTRAAVVRIDAIEIGRIRVENVDAVVLKDDALSSTLIGMSLLKQMARFEVKDGVLLLQQ